MPSLLTPHLQHDQPLDPQRADDHAEFHFDNYANTFARLIAHIDPKTGEPTRTPLVLGISGKWGSGKTTLLKRIRGKLDETKQLNENLSKVSFANSDEEAKDFRRCRTVWFNAWKYADEDQLLVALVRVIVQAMSKDDKVAEFLSKIFVDPLYPRRDVIATVLNWFAIKLPGIEIKPDVDKYKTETPFGEKTALLDLFSDTFDRLMAVWVHRSLDAKEIDPNKGVMVVFIDDLDRCLPDKAVQVLEAVKLFLDRPGAAFVLAADEDTVRAAIEAHYQTQKITRQRASDYLEKIFQVRFPLPPLAALQVSDYISKALGEVDDQLKRLVVIGAESNPRQIKTFLNDLNVGWAILKNSGQAEGVEQADFIRWLALRRVGPAFCEKARELPHDRRLDFINDAVKWANDPTHKPGEYEQWQGAEHRRLRDMLKLIEFSPQVTPEILEGFIFWSGLAEIEAKRQAELAAKRQAELEAQRQAEEKRRAELAAKQQAELEAQRRAEPPEVMRGVERTPKRESPSLTAGDYWVTIPAGKFVMGSRDDNKMAADDERPQHTVEIPYSYRIARYSVTNAEFSKFVEATGYKSKAVKAEFPDHPVVNVSWRDAQAYCEWLTGQLRADGTLGAKEIARLPTEAEWEKAARGEYGREWPWGDEWDAAKCNNAESGPKTTTPVGKYSPQGDSPYGVADMVGNAWEWCRSKYKPYPYKADDGRENLKGKEDRVVRGGSWANNLRDCRSACRFRFGSANFIIDIGFRVALSPV